MAATFTHTIRIDISLGGRTTTYSYSYTVSAVIEKIQHNEVLQDWDNPQPQVGKVAVGAKFYAAIGRFAEFPINASATNVAASKTLQSRYLEDGDVLILHAAATGGSFNNSATLTTTTFLVADSLSVTPVVTGRGLAADLIALYE